MSGRRARWRTLHAPAFVFFLMLSVLVAVYGMIAERRGTRLPMPWTITELGVWLTAAVLVSYLAWLLARMVRSERRKARFAAALAQEVLDNVPDAVLIVDSRGQVVSANVPLLDIAGVSPLLVIGHDLDELQLRDERGGVVPWPRAGTTRARLGSTVSPVEIEVAARALPGTPGYGLIHVRNVTKEANDLRLITDQASQLELLTQLGLSLNRVTSEEELLHLAVTHLARSVPLAAAGGVFVVDRDASVLRLGATFGLSPEFVASEQEIPLGECLCGQVALTGEARFSASSADDYFHTRHRGASPHGHLILPLRAETGVIGVLFLYLREGAALEGDNRRLLEGVASEVGLALMRVREHAALRQSQNRLQRLFDEAPDAMMVVDDAGAVLRVNRRARRWFAVGENVTAHLPWTDVVALGKAGGGPIRARLISSPHSEAVVELTASAAGSGELQLILRDITRETALERQAQELQKMEVVGALAAGLAHNLNNIFASVLAHLFQLREITADTRGVDLTLRGGDLEYAKRHLDAAVGGAEQVSVLIERLLEYARPRAPRLETLDLGRVLREQIELARPLISASVEVRAELQDGIHVQADRSIVVNALLNLLLNATNAMPLGGALQVRVGPDAGQHAWFEVQDSGVGMDQATLARIFEPFFTTRQAGTGLGLSTLRAGVTSLGGRVEVTSEPGQGTTFRVHLPRATPSRSAEPAGGRPGRHRILLAEDSAVLRAFTARHLEESGWEVRGVGSVGELRSLARRWSPDVAVVDWNLADGNVAGVLAELQAASGLVVIVSGDPEAVPAAGMPVLGKPVDWERLEALIRDARA